MYKSFFKLRFLPFGSSPDPRFVYLMPQIRETLACLQYGIAARKGFVVMTGEVGTGKTTLLKTVLDTFSKERVSTAVVVNPLLDVIDFLEFVLTDFGIPPTTRTKSGMIIQLNRWLIERYKAKAVCAIVVDEAQHLSWELLEEIRLLTNLETGSDKLLQIVLSGQPELEEKLRAPCVRQLRQRISLWCRTRPLTSQETHDYIMERLRIAGACSAIFSPEAIQTAHAHSSGIPRLINLICDNALVSAYAEQVQPIPVGIVEEVCRELELNQQPFLVSPAPFSPLTEGSSSDSSSRAIESVVNAAASRKGQNP
ncbi:MAG: ExeA family protein [Terracidiphilus sp.]